jgi:NAD(P)-dependent dehydrogenase (short-subunit alcohol dehydrogenase family)
VTGGSSGIGLAIAFLLAQQGVSVALTSRKLERAQQAAATIQSILLSTASASASAPSVLALQADVRSTADVDAAVESAWKAFGQRLDIVVHAAGVSHDALIVRASDTSVVLVSCISRQRTHIQTSQLFLSSFILLAFCCSSAGFAVTLLIHYRPI